MAITYHQSLENFYKQIDHALENYRAHGLKTDQFTNIIIGGLGGSGIGGKIIKSYFQKNCPLPIEVVSDYHFPASLKQSTLAILCSYSGNTEETLSLYKEAKAKGGKIIVLTSGGSIKEWAEKDGCIVYHIETGFQPRMALGYSVAFQALIFAELLSQDVTTEFREVSALLKNTEKYNAQAREMQAFFEPDLHYKHIVITDGHFEGVALRFSQQINENSKHECFVNTLPEANHNAIESYYGKQQSNFIFLNSGLDERNTIRFQFLKQLLDKHSNKIWEFKLEGCNWKNIFETIHMQDWYSINIAEKLKVNPMQIENINNLKDFLGKN